jgi:hypothetical protein
MSGTKQQVESIQTFVAATLSAAASSLVNSLEGISVIGLVDGALCYVRADRTVYRYSESSTEAPDGSRVVAPLSGAGRWLLSSAATVLTFPQLRVGTGGTAPTIAEAGPTLGWLFTVGDLIYCEVPIPSNADRGQPAIIGIGWAPSGSEVGTVVRWQTDIGFEQSGSNVAAIEDTRTVDTAAPVTAASYARSAISIPAAVWGADPADEEFHIRVSRAASGSDPVAEPGIHHVAVIFPVHS